MASTTRKNITASWQKISDGDCTVQSLVHDTQFYISVGATTPKGEEYIILKLTEATTFAYSSPVWCRVADASASQPIVVIA